MLNSLTDGRLMKQCHNLIKNCKYPLLLIELGEVGSAVHPNAVLGAMAHITLDIGIPVMMTKNTLETAHFLSIAAKRKNDVFDGLKKSSTFISDEDEINSKIESAKKEIELLISDDTYQSPLVERWNIEALNKKTELITNIMGVKLETAKFLLEQFGSLASLLTADKTDLIKIGKIESMEAEKIINRINLQ